MDQRDPARPWMLSLLALGILLRVALTAVNPPWNSFDDHYEPVLLAIKLGAIPGKLDCWQCYHPPVMYVLSTLAAHACALARLDAPTMHKVLQGLNCAFGAGALLVVYAMLRGAAAGALARVSAFAFFAVLPRHLYMSAMFANDAAATFFIVLTAWACVLWLRGGGLWICALLAGAATAAIFTKYTAFAVLPMIAAAIAVAFRQGQTAPRRLVPVFLALLLPVASLGASMAANQRRYGAALPSNISFDDNAKRQVSDDPRGMRFTTFEPWLFVRFPMIRPGQTSSFWTLLQAGFYFDDEPRMSLLFGRRSDWRRYYDWFKGLRAAYPGVFAPAAFLRMGSALEALGLFWLALAVTGFVRFVRRPWRESGRQELGPLLVLMAFSLAGVVWITHLMPAMSTAKSSYLMGAAPAFAALIVAGVEGVSAQKPLRWTIVACTAAYVGISAAHAVYWVLELKQ